MPEEIPPAATMRVIYNINKELCIIAGIITDIYETEDRFIITVQYEEGNSKFRQTVKTKVVFINQDPEPDNPPKLYAKWAKEKNASVGDRIIIFARFPSSNHQIANGYSCKLNGIITVSATEHSPERNIISGLVDAIKQFSKDKKDYAVIRMYLGSDPIHGAKRTLIYMNDHYLINRCMRDLQPGPGGEKSYAAFLCGEKNPYVDKMGNLKESYVGFDFTPMGKKRTEAKIENHQN